jgi:hypothetical protein
MTEARPIANFLLAAKRALDTILEDLEHAECWCGHEDRSVWEYEAIFEHQDECPVRIMSEARSNAEHLYLCRQEDWRQAEDLEVSEWRIHRHATAKRFIWEGRARDLHRVLFGERDAAIRLYPWGFPSGHTLHGDTIRPASRPHRARKRGRNA